MYVCVAIVVVIMLLIWWLVITEGLEDPFYLDYLVMKHPDPTRFKYTGRTRDILGMTGRDYYLENDMLHRARTVDDIYGANKFVNQNNYLGMPAEYRPKAAMPPVDRPQGSVESQEFKKGADASEAPLSPAEATIVAKDVVNEQGKAKAAAAESFWAERFAPGYFAGQLPKEKESDLYIPLF